MRDEDHGQYRSVETTGYLTGCCILARREVWERVGPLDERYFIYAEDADWSLRARRLGVALLFVPTARLWHKVSSTTTESSRWKTYQRLRANWLLFSRHAQGLGRVTWLPGFVLQQLALFAWFVLNGRLEGARGIPRGLWDALLGKSPAEVTP